MVSQLRLLIIDSTDYREKNRNRESIIKCGFLCFGTTGFKLTSTATIPTTPAMKTAATTMKNRQHKSITSKVAEMVRNRLNKFILNLKTVRTM